METDTTSSAGGADRRKSSPNASQAPEPDAPGGEYDVDQDDWEEDSGPRPELVPPFLMTLWRLVARRPIQPDRSRSLGSESRGRLDKLDLWLVVALVIAALCLRVWRLGEPTQMHFDEVYHARTATEFLQDWRYGIRHDIYEWTHPHLAKYSIAVGLTVFSNDKVTAAGSLGVPVKDAVVQPRVVIPNLAKGQKVTPMTDPGGRQGERVYVATGSEVRVYDLESRALTHTYAVPGASALSLEPNSRSLFVGTSDGRVFVIDTVSLDEVRLGVAKEPSGARDVGVDTGLNTARLFAVTNSGSQPLVLAADAEGNVVSIDSETGKVLARSNVPQASDFVAFASSTTVSIVPPSQSSTPTESPTPTASSTPAPTATASGSSPAPTPTATSTPEPTGVAAEVLLLADALDLDPTVVQAAFDAAREEGLEQRLPGVSVASAIDEIQKLIDEGKLPDVRASVDTPTVLVAYRDGVGTMDARHLVITSTLHTDQPATSIAVSSESDKESYVAAGSTLLLVRIDTGGGSGSISQDTFQPLKKMPGPVTRVILDDSTKVAQALGKAPDGSGWTVYAIETNANSVFFDARLPFEPVAWGADVSRQYPSTDRHELLVFASDGSTAAVDIGQFAFAWRIVGVLFGTLMAACLFLLARVLFRRRSVGLLVALFSLVDGMFFANARIAMNDTYVGALLVLAYLIFALLWMGTWKGRWAFWLGMPLLGTVLGLALAAKWVALYAIASMGILILVRSALGRIIVILGLAGGAGVFGWQAIAEAKFANGTGDPPQVVLWLALGIGAALAGLVVLSRFRATADRVLVGLVTAAVVAVTVVEALVNLPAAKQNGSPNFTFFMIMTAATVIAAAANAYHPIAWTKQEVRFAIGAPIAAGLGLALAGALFGQNVSDFMRAAINSGIGGAKLEVWGAYVAAAGLAVAAAFWFAGLLGFGPMAQPPRPDDPAAHSGPPAPAPTGWLRLGSGFGLPAVWIGACLIVLPLAVYTASFVPWAAPWHQEPADSNLDLPVLWCAHPDDNDYCTNGDGWPSGHTGQTLWGLTQGIYSYHNDLRSPHAASSPWWAWPMDLKPVWFEQIGYAQDSTSLIYDGGNPALWWLAIVAMAFVCWQAFKRRSLGLTLIAMAFFWQWLSWARIDRASFQYHFYTSLPFFLLALAYFMAEVWHGPSPRTWLLARVAAAGTLLVAPVLWLAKNPLCGLARVSLDDGYRKTACGPVTQAPFELHSTTFLIGLILVAALVALGLILYRSDTRQSEGSDTRAVAEMFGAVGIAVAAMLWVSRSVTDSVLVQTYIPSSSVAAIALVLMAGFALFVLWVRDARRYVLAFCIVAVLVFIGFYPNLSALPMPGNIASIYQGFLPTWVYGFQFSVNQQLSAEKVELLGRDSLTFIGVALTFALVAAYAAWVHRIVIGYRRHLAEVAAGGGEGEAAGQGTGEGGGAAE
jgi:hypothetical protein